MSSGYSGNKPQNNRTPGENFSLMGSFCRAGWVAFESTFRPVLSVVLMTGLFLAIFHVPLPWWVAMGACGGYLALFVVLAAIAYFDEQKTGPNPNKQYLKIDNSGWKNETARNDTPQSDVRPPSQSTSGVYGQPRTPSSGYGGAASGSGYYSSQPGRSPSGTYPQNQDGRRQSGTYNAPNKPTGAGTGGNGNPPYIPPKPGETYDPYGVGSWGTKKNPPGT